MLLTVIICVVIIGAITFYVLQQKRVPVRVIDHPYFSRLWLWPPGSHTRWEAEMDATAPGLEEVLGVHSETVHEQDGSDVPTEAEIAFCKRLLGDVDELFALSRTAIERAWQQWVGAEMPQDWRKSLSLNGFSVPHDGDLTEPWGATYFCVPAGHYFHVKFERGEAYLESVEG